MKNGFSTQPMKLSGESQAMRRTASSGFERDAARRLPTYASQRELRRTASEGFPLAPQRERMPRSSRGDTLRRERDLRRASKGHALPGPSTAEGPAIQVGADTLQSRGKNYAGNQDRFVHRNGDSMFFAGVFDGHGAQGDRVAEYSKENLTREVLARVPGVGPERALLQGFEATAGALRAGPEHGAQYSGTTAVTALLPDSSSILVANCGDSRAVLGRVGTGRRVEAVDLSRDQNPSDPDERRRIEALKGRIHASLVPVPSIGQLVPMGPERVWDKSGSCGLAVSRSLGDLHMAPFVSPQPEITQRKLDAKDRLVILASDGVWGQMSSQQAVDIAARHTSPTKAAQEITQVCRQRWLHETGNRMCDDITCVVVNLTPALPTPETLGSAGSRRARSTAR